MASCGRKTGSPSMPSPRLFWPSTSAAASSRLAMISPARRSKSTPAVNWCRDLADRFYLLQHDLRASDDPGAQRYPNLIRDLDAARMLSTPLPEGYGIHTFCIAIA